MGFRFDLLWLFTTLVLLSTTTPTVLSDVILSKVDRRVSFAISDILFS
jgi:oligosaccharyltransferase complex subunit alpha (ribophorin I)